MPSRLRLHFQVKAHFLIEVAVESPAPEEEKQLSPEFTNHLIPTLRRLYYAPNRLHYAIELRQLERQLFSPSGR